MSATADTATFTGQKKAKEAAPKVFQALAHWLSKPLQEVANNGAPLRAAPNVVHTISLATTKAVPYTTFNAVCRSFIPAIRYRRGHTSWSGSEQPAGISTTTGLVTDHQDARVTALSAIDQRRVFIRSHGLDPTTNKLVRIHKRVTRSLENDPLAATRDTSSATDSVSAEPRGTSVERSKKNTSKAFAPSAPRNSSGGPHVVPSETPDLPPSAPPPTAKTPDPYTYCRSLPVRSVQSTTFIDPTDPTRPIYTSHLEQKKKCT